MSKKILIICGLASVAMASLAESLGENDVIYAFDDLHEAQKSGLISGVELLIAEPEAGPEARHNAWLAQMRADGWTYGKNRSDEEKKHPRVVEFDKLPKREIAKERMLHAVVRHLAAVELGAEVGAAAPVQATVVTEGTKLVKYIGNKEEHHDNLYGTKLEWKQGQTHSVPSAIAAKMAVHADTYEVAGDGAPIAKVVEPVKDSESQEDKGYVGLPNLQTMNRTELANYAQQQFGEILGGDMSEDDMRGTLLSMVQQDRGL